jgi:hypothetical protein
MGFMAVGRGALPDYWIAERLDSERRKQVQIGHAAIMT